MSIKIVVIYKIRIRPLLDHTKLLDYCMYTEAIMRKQVQKFTSASKDRCRVIALICKRNSNIQN